MPPPRVTTAFVLAAGMGRRMQPLTDVVPKPLIHLGGRTLLDHVLDRLAAAGFERTVVNVHYKADQIEDHLAARTAPAITISDERDALLETGGGVMRALPLLGHAPFLIHNSDSVWLEHGISNVERLLTAWNPETMDCLMLLADKATSLGYDGAGDFDLASDGRVSRRQKGTEAPYVFTGVSIADPRLFDGAPSGAFSLNVVWDLAIARGRVSAILLDGTWMHAGTPEALADAEQRLVAHHG